MLVKFQAVQSTADIAFVGFVYIRSWRSRITQQIPILKIGGSNPFERAKKKHLRGSGDVFFYGIRRRDSNPERVSGVKKTVRGTVYRREVRDGYCRIRRRSSRDKKSRIYLAFLFVLLSFLYVFILFSLKRERLFRGRDKRLTVLSIINLR